MILRFVLCALLLAAATASTAAPPPPPPPEQEGQLRNFLKALPKRVPQDLDAFAAYVSPEVKVYREGKLTYPDRNSWFAYLRGFAGKAPDEPQGISVSRESLYRVAGDGIAAMEFSYPLAPTGKEGQIAYHPDYPLQLVTYYLDEGRLTRVDYGHPMDSIDYLLKQVAPGSPPPSTDPAACPQQPEPPTLSSAGFDVPVEGDTLLFSAAPSNQSIRFAVRVIRRPGSSKAWATLVRLKRRFDCNVLDQMGTWDFELSAKEADALFGAVASLERTPPETDVTIDGTQVEFQHHTAGKKVFGYSSNGAAKERLSAAMLEVVRHHVPAPELPASPDWRTTGPTINTAGTRTESVFATVGHSEWCPAGNVLVDLATGHFDHTPTAPRPTCADATIKRPVQSGTLAPSDLSKLRAAFQRGQSEGLQSEECRTGKPIENIIVSNGGRPVLLLNDGRSTAIAPEDPSCWSAAASNLHNLLDELFARR